MANEFKLNFTAEDINRRLTDIDNKQNNLTSGDLIEIKDGIIRSTLGDDTGEIIESYTEMVSWVNMLWEGEETLFYPYNPEAIESNLSENIEEGKIYDIFFTLSGQNTSLHCQSDCVYVGGETPCLSFNIDLNHYFETEEFIKENEDLPGFLVAIFYDKDEDYTGIEMIGDADYTGSSLSIGIFESKKKYISLPDNALQSGNLIKIENGMIRSTLGEKIVSKKDVKLFTIDSIPSDHYDSESGLTNYDNYCNYIPMEGDIINLQLLLNGSENIISFNNIETKVFIDEDGYKIIYNFINTNQTYEDVAIKGNAPEKIDETLPWIGVLWIKDEEENYCVYSLIVFEDITGASIQVDGNITIENIVKLPNKALTFDEEPMEDSKNLVTSDGIHRAIGKVKSSFVYDSQPIQYSQNLMKSGAIYDAFNSFENSKVPQAISNYIGNNTTGFNIGKTGSAYGAEIFNSYSNNVANKQYSHAEGEYTTASGYASHAECSSTVASGAYSHAEGFHANANKHYSHAEGYYTAADGSASHAEGSNTIAGGDYSHSEGNHTLAEGEYSHAEGWGENISINLTGDAGTRVYTVSSHNDKIVIGRVLKYGTTYTTISEYDSSTLTIKTSATLSSSSALNSTDVTLYLGIAYGIASHAEGYYTTAKSQASHAEGYYTIASGYASHAEGNSTIASKEFSHAEGNRTTANGSNSHAEGEGTTTSGNGSHAEGYETIANGNYSHAEGTRTKSQSNASHAEGEDTTASGSASHAEGFVTTASGLYSHAEGDHTTAKSQASHAEGYYTTANGHYSHAEGNGTTAIGYASHVEGKNTKAKGLNSHVEGIGRIQSVILTGDAGATTYTSNSSSYLGVGSILKYGETYAKVLTNDWQEGILTITTDLTLSPSDVLNSATVESHFGIASGDDSHAEGNSTIASGNGSHAEGFVTTANGDYSHAEGLSSKAKGKNAHAEGYSTRAYGENSHTEGYDTETKEKNTHAEGHYTRAYGENSHAEGDSTQASGLAAHAEGYSANAYGDYSHAEGYNTEAGIYSHAEGYNTEASNYSHAEGYATEAANYSHVEGYNTRASNYSHAEGCETLATGLYSHAEGYGTLIRNSYSHVQGKFNSDQVGFEYAHIVGNGTDENNRSNAHTLDWDGNAWYSGTIEATAIILTSPSGQKFKITVDDNGTLSATAI